MIEKTNVCFHTVHGEIKLKLKCADIFSEILLGDEYMSTKMTILTIHVTSHILQIFEFLSHFTYVSVCL